MRLPLTLAALLSASLAAGCIGGAGETMTAREGLDDARAAAEAWADGEDLGLLGAVAIEPFKRFRYESDDGGHEAEYVTHLDGNPGDGRAPGWAYAFTAGERCVSIVLAAGIGVLAEGYETCDGDLDAMPEWSVDSDEVAEILRGEEDWPDLGEDGSYFWALHSEDGDALWAVGGTGEGGESAFASVDAGSGEVLQVVHGDEGDIEGLFDAEAQAEAQEARGGSDQDTASEATLAADDQLVAEVDLGGMGRLIFRFTQAGGLTPHRVTIEGPYGVVDEFDVGPVVGAGMGQEGRTYHDLPAGHYVVTLEAQTAAVLPSISVFAEW